MTSLSQEKQTEPGRPIRVGLIGVTGYGHSYYEEILKLLDRGLVSWGAVTIINPEEASEQVSYFKSHNIPIYDDYREMLSREGERLDWLCIPTAISWHMQMALDGLACGLPVLLEKPVAGTLQEVEAIEKAQRDSGQMVAIGFQYIYSPRTIEIKQRLLNGELGEIQYVDCLSLWPRDTSYYHRNNWAGCVHDGHGWVLDSPLHNALSHIINLMLFFAGKEPNSRAELLEVSAELYRAKNIQNYDTIRCEAKFDTGPLASVLLSHSTVNHFDPEIRIQGTKGTIVWRFSGRHSIETSEGAKYLEAEDPLSVRDCMFDKIVRRLRGDTSIDICTIELAKGEVIWVNAVQDAAPIHEVPAEFRCRLTGDNGEIFDVVDQLDDYAMQAFEKRCSFKELGVPWAVEPGRIDLSNYRGFEGRQISPEDLATIQKD